MSLNANYTSLSNPMPQFFSVTFFSMNFDLNCSYSSPSLSCYTHNSLPVFYCLYKRSFSRFPFLMTALTLDMCHIACLYFCTWIEKKNFNTASLNLHHVLLSEPSRLTRGHSFTDEDQKLCQVCTRARNGPWMSRTNTAWDLKKLIVIHESNVHPKVLEGSVELIYLSLI